MSTITNGRSTPAAPSTSSTRAWSVQDAGELYEVARWGHGYFSVNGAGHVQVHPTKDPAQAIDLKELIDRLQLRGISLPVLVRFTDILRHRLGEIHSAFQSAIAQNQLPGRLQLRVSHQGQPAAAGRRGGARLRPAVQVRPRSRLQARAARGGRHRRQRHAHHLQRVQGRRVHRNGDAGAQDRPQHHSGGREVHRARSHSGSRRKARRTAADWGAGQARRQGQRTMAVVRGLSLQVWPLR